MQQSRRYDLVIAHGRVIDPETRLDDIRHVGIVGDKIAAISEAPLAGEQVVDATGHVVAPGFIDPHCHGASDAFSVKLGVLDGKTTQLDLEMGAWPVDLWYDRLEGRAQSHYGASVGHLNIRDDVFSDFRATTGNLFIEMWKSKGAWSTRKASAAELERILAKVEDGLQHGALGVGTPVGYATQGMTTYELNQVWSAAGRHGLFATVHGRFSSFALPTEGMLGLLEAMANAQMHGAGLLIHHYHGQVLDQVEEMARIVDQARANGVKVLLEVYPYTFGSSVMMSDYLEPANYQKNMGHSYEDITLVRTMKPLTKETYEQERRSSPTATILFDHCTEADMLTALAWPTVCVGSDAIPYIDDKSSHDAEGALTVPYDFPFEDARGHPRGAGTFARVFRMVREQQVMSLDLAVAKTSYLVAKFLEQCGVAQMAFKGRIQVGADADVTVFDPATITDSSTRVQGALPSSGISHVIVDGTPVLRDGRIVEGVYPGRPIRRPITAQA